ncbi:MAG: response regulator transcription factor [Treponema sp.]|nr:response regulator transcription factor [Treponema sp.]
MIRLVLADSHEEYRGSLFNCLSRQKDFELIGLGKDGYEAIRLTENLKPDVTLLDMDLPPLGGIQLAELLTKKCTTMAVIILNSGEGERLLGFNGCIAGYLNKTTGPELLYDAIRTVYHGGRLITPGLAEQIDRVMLRKGYPILLKDREYQYGPEPVKARKEIPPNISRKELEIMGCIGRGLTNREIAEKLRLREGTVRNYISVLLQKTGLHHRTQVAIYALKHGLAKSAPG